MLQAGKNQPHYILRKQILVDGPIKPHQKLPGRTNLKGRAPLAADKCWRTVL